MKYDFLKSGRKGKFPSLFIPAGLALLCAVLSAEAEPIAQSPLFLTLPVKPNIMLMLDNSGSMNNIVPEAPFDETQNYLNCPDDNQIQIPPGNTQAYINIDVSGSTPYIIYGGNQYTLGTTAGHKCFKPDGTYGALLKENSKNADGEYSGNYLNWYFNPSNTTGTWDNGHKPGTQTRMTIAKKAATDLVGSLEHVRLGLSAYYDDHDGGALLETVEDIDEISDKKQQIKDKIAGLKAENNTPLAETLSDIGHYFTTGYTGNLTLHPGKTNQEQASVATIFTQGSVSGHKLYNGSGQTVTSPIQHSCQKSFAMLMTDGRPNQDRDISASLRDYSGDCAAGLCKSEPEDISIPPGKLNTLDYKNGTKIETGRTYEWAGSDYLDDVAQALFEMDLRPDLIKSKPGEKNNLITYAIGFADPALVNDPLLRDTASRGGGQFKPAENSAELSQAFNEIIAEINNQVEVGSASSLTSNSTRLDASTRIYQAGFNSANWSGSLKAFALVTKENSEKDNDNDGVLDSDEDINKNNKLDLIGSVIEPAKWESTIPAANNRRILSYNPAATSKGISFEWVNLSPAQQASLDSATATSATSSPVLDYLRGDQSNEKAKGGTYRDRASLLGDIVNSDPLVVTNSDDFGYSLLDGDEGSTYNDFRADKAARTNALYVGANDGMLHAFNADNGAELFAYIPNAVIPQLKKLTNKDYGCRRSGCIAHEYFVDGSPRAGDAYVAIGASAASWRTILLGSTGAGSGKAVFALDITDPNPTKSTAASTIGADKVLWEVSPDQAPITTDLADNITITPAKLGFTNNLGYTIPQPSLVRMNNGSWAAIVANGYNSVSNKAVLFILNAATGAIIRTIDTGVGSASLPNGLSSAYPVDVDGDRVFDFIYAGDLLGNLWKFDVQSSQPNNWKVAYSSGSPAAPAPLFTACSGACTGANYQQPITAKPQVGRHPQGGLMVYFGTGKYYEAGDQIVGSSPQVQSFYGIRDQGSPVSGRSLLQQQEILAEDAVVRATSNTEVDYAGNSTVTPAVPAKQGWYMDLVTPKDNKKGERVVSQAILRGGNLTFITLIPSNDACSPGGTSWIMGLDAVEGKRPKSVAFDTNKNGLLNDSDKKRMDTNKDGVSNSSDETVNLSGSSNRGIVKNITNLSNGDDTSTSLSNNNKGEIGRELNPDGDPIGRQSWRQIR